ncbi:hepatitis A virus cellular receptor 1 homolog isoform X2 [Limanda limanda]|uniref:hepatitis A virus cellular receptor 1 homolog isoform X2 n=1 Tax=Limanda limanda TaxID=27771 RepID=UPI0029C66CA4|nr:hepatitis A virus cellular receptor 1 homolog isoform X2 [Limanda limanda]
MNAHLILIFFSLSSLLQDGLTQRVFTGPEGGSVTVSCSFNFSGWTKRFCRKSCEDGDVLFETEGVRAQRDRYSIRYNEGSYLQSYSFVHVTIKQLRKSDSGHYTCGLKRTPLHRDTYEKVEIIVTDASPSSTPNRPVEPSPTSLPAATATAPSSSSPETSEESSATSSSPGTSEESSAPQTTALLLNVSFIIIIVITLTVTVMAFCRIRTSKHTG